MTDVIEATATSLKQTVDGKEYEFHFLNAYDRAALLAPDLERRQAAHDRRKSKFIENLKTAGTDGEQVLADREPFEDRYPEERTDDDGAGFCRRPATLPPILELSLAKSITDG